MSRFSPFFTLFVLFLAIIFHLSAFADPGEDREIQEAIRAQEAQISELDAVSQAHAERMVELVRSSQAEQISILKETVKAQKAQIVRLQALCFPAETPISVKDNSRQGYHAVPIQSVHVGDLVVSCNLEAGETCEYGEVKHVIENKTDQLFKLTISGKSLRATGNHPFYVVDKKEWVEAQDLRVGDSFRRITGDIVTLDDIEIETGEFTVYNLDIGGNHNYYACDVLVHNCTIGAVVGISATYGTQLAEFGSASYNFVGRLSLGVAAIGTAALSSLTQYGSSAYDVATHPVTLGLVALGAAAYYGPKVYSYIKFQTPWYYRIKRMFEARPDSRAIAFNKIKQANGIEIDATADRVHRYNFYPPVFDHLFNEGRPNEVIIHETPGQYFETILDGRTNHRFYYRELRSYRGPSFDTESSHPQC